MKRWTLFLLIVLGSGVVACFSFAYPRIKQFVYNRKLDLHVEAIDKEAFYARMQEPPPKWMQKQIDADLALYKSTHISPHTLDLVYRSLSDKKLLRCQINGNHFAYQSTVDLGDIRCKSMVDGIAKICEIYPYLHVDFIIGLEDEFTGIHLPLFVFAKNRKNPHQILLPDFSCFAQKTTTYAWTYSLYPKIQKAAKKMPWKDKCSLAVWRGTNSGSHHAKSGSSCTNSRCKLCTLSQFHPHLINAKFSQLNETNKEAIKHMKSHYFVGGFMTPEEHLRYKYLITLDGNTCTYPGLAWRLLSNSCVIKTMTNQIQWYYAGLEPWVHFIPVDKDLSNLLPNLQWAYEHDEEASQMAVRASEYARDNLSQEGIYLYLCHLLKEYEEVYNENLSFVDSHLHEKAFFSIH